MILVCVRGLREMQCDCFILRKIAREQTALVYGALIINSNRHKTAE